MSCGANTFLPLFAWVRTTTLACMGRRHAVQLRAYLSDEISTQLCADVYSAKALQAEAG
jgi:hypothetical protein